MSIWSSRRDDISERAPTNAVYSAWLLVVDGIYKPTLTIISPRESRIIQVAADGPGLPLLPPSMYIENAWECNALMGSISNGEKDIGMSMRFIARRNWSLEIKIGIHKEISMFLEYVYLSNF
jgi:hypothetical protein